MPALLPTRNKRSRLDNINLALHVKRIRGDHYTGTFRVNAFLNQHRHEDFRVIYYCSLASFVSLKVPQRSPDGFDSLNKLLGSPDIGNCSVKTCAAELWQVFRIGRTANEQAFAVKFLPDSSQNLCL